MIKTSLQRSTGNCSLINELGGEGGVQCFTTCFLTRLAFCFQPLGITVVRINNQKDSHLNIVHTVVSSTLKLSLHKSNTCLL